MAGRAIVPAMAAKKSVATPKRAMSKQHKAALAVGRAEGLAVRRYLDALEAHKPKRGRKRTRSRSNAGWRPSRHRFPTRPV
jgi:hypothetical protein